MFSTVSKIVLFSFISLIFAASLPPADYGRVARKAGDVGPLMGEMSFRGTIHGVEVQLNGTVESIYSQFQALHPSVVARHQSETNGTLPATNSFSSHLGKRDDKLFPPLCNVQNWGPAQVTRIQEGINYLNHFNGVCNSGPGCTRISCSYGSGIHLCNDNNYEVVQNCGYLATYAQDIINVCQTYDKGSDRWWTTGQEFNTNRFNIYVKGEEC